ncbi:C4-dicarboxylic acid transporter DauA [Thiomicrorhabdus lithotrophica]|uniref:C4-dicarboxylic acid transporter DauA n=1 Tax=Thiomicrorhabdus lithotrophica TaxID=2949997 RepID=A0ABY8CFW8_9GAMM|nr:C4-dicarboxylic acid transporter DauA [Thiomicrorhabdus lithotrophica]WEJ63033.1 C4-dicarboxylic acid transporter DauA [Thiomicrorhabdus lithotrophica]
MPHRNNLTSLKIGYGLRDYVEKEGGYTRTSLNKDLIAGLTVGILTIPISMALATGIGVSPIYGLYTAIVAGIVTALAGGSRFSIAGPTASFVILLIPVAEDYGMFGVMMVSVLGGFLLMLMAWFRFGRWIEYIPEAITLGFTTGIAALIILLQMKDFFGLTMLDLPSDFMHRLWLMVQGIPELHWESTVVGLGTLVFMLLWTRLKINFPGHLPGLVIATIITFYWNQQGAQILTVGELFDAIPHYLPSFQGQLIADNIVAMSSNELWEMFKVLLPVAFVLAVLGAMESLFCAVILDNVAGTRHSPNSELLGQGLGNVFSPLFGGFASSGAIARSITNLKAGAVSPISGVIHALVVIFAIYFLADWLMHMPMPGMSALLILVAWRMSEFPRAIALVKSPSNNDAWVYLSCFLMILLFDVVIAVTIGMVLASFLFIKEIAEMTKLQDIHTNERYHSELIPDDWNFYRIQGPLFFAAADRIFGELSATLQDKKGIVIQMDAVTILDSGGLSALRRFVTNAEAHGVVVYLSELQFQPLKTLVRYGLNNFGNNFKLYSNLDDAQLEVAKVYSLEDKKQD